MEEKITANRSEHSEPVKSLEQLDKLVELSLLYDFYGALLSEHKQQIFEDYVLNDLSLSEIAAEKSISRQGVYDIVRRCSKELTEYEEKLHLLEKFSKTKDMVNQIHQTAKVIQKSGDIELIEKIEEISNGILEGL